MRRSELALTRTDVLVLLLVVGLAVGLLIPILGVHPQETGSGRKACSNNLTQIGKACIAYQAWNNDFFPAQSQSCAGVRERILPMPSLAILYPNYIDSFRVFGCPNTKDTPCISIRLNDGFRWACFGAEKKGVAVANPVAYTGNELGTNMKCSYFYDEHTNPKLATANMPIACDADGQTSIDAESKPPLYSADWTRIPRKSNHDYGQNVLFYGGYVKWSDTSFCAEDATDNIFTSGGKAPGATEPREPDVDAYLWDGVNARAEE